MSNSTKEKAMKHTPGPWKVVNWRGETVVSPDKDLNCQYTICQLYGPDAEANANLIASAPELLETCKMQLEWYLARPRIETRMVDHLFDIISKAEGKQ